MDFTTKTWRARYAVFSRRYPSVGIGLPVFGTMAVGFFVLTEVFKAQEKAKVLNGRNEEAYQYQSVESNIISEEKLVLQQKRDVIQVKVREMDSGSHERLYSIKCSGMMIMKWFQLFVQRIHNSIFIHLHSFVLCVT